MTAGSMNAWASSSKSDAAALNTATARSICTRRLSNCSRTDCHKDAGSAVDSSFGPSDANRFAASAPERPAMLEDPKNRMHCSGSIACHRGTDTSAIVEFGTAGSEDCGSIVRNELLDAIKLPLQLCLLVLRSGSLFDRRKRYNRRRECCNDIC